MKNKKLFAILTLVCFMMTLMPVAAFAAVDAETSSFVAIDGDQSVRLDEKTGLTKEIKFDLDLLNADENGTTGTVYIWAVNENGTVSSALDVVGGVEDDITNVFKYEPKTSNDEVKIQFKRAGKYKVYAGLKGAGDDSASDLNKFSCEFSTITVKSSSVDPDTYKAIYGDKIVSGGADDTTLGSISVKPNNVLSDKIEVEFNTADDKALKGKTVSISTNSAAIETNKTSDVTNAQGKIDFKVSASVEGTYEVELTVDGVSWTITVVSGNTGAAYIKTAAEPKAPQALYGDLNKSNPAKGTKVRFDITDINGNTVTGKDQTVASDGMGMNGIVDADGKYIVLTEKPEDSDLESEDLELRYSSDDQKWYLYGTGTLDAEGTYSVKVILDNGAYATATWEVKKFQTPVQLRIDTAVNTVALGASISAELTYVDANGVEKAAKDAELAATGYAVANVVKTTVTAKSDEKYVGEKITVSAVSEKYNLVASKEYTVVGEAVAVAFVDKTAEVNVNNKLAWNLTDEDGNRIAIANAEEITVQYVVLDKPEGAKVSTTDRTNLSDLKNKGIGEMALTSNKIGNVAVQVVVKAKYAATSNAAQQVKYYTGTQIFAVGNGSVGDVVVMSVGSNEIVINDAKATIDAAPIVKNDRTFVPFRALAEAFGAEVAYDEATQAVTAELNGVKVVMTIGSATYTVNGAEKTMDVAPFINGSRTMVPVRFVAESFGIKVIPTYDENGATADILFNL